MGYNQESGGVTKKISHFRQMLSILPRMADKGEKGGKGKVFCTRDLTSTVQSCCRNVVKKEA